VSDVSAVVSPSHLFHANRGLDMGRYCPLVNAPDLDSLGTELQAPTGASRTSKKALAPLSGTSVVCFVDFKGRRVMEVVKDRSGQSSRLLSPTVQLVARPRESLDPNRTVMT